MFFDVWLLVLIAGGYCIGSIPSGYVIAWFKGVGDIRRHGSGNIGATNVARVLGLKYFFIVFCADFLKSWGYLALSVALGFSYDYCIAAGVALLVGNGCSMFLGFRGGKAVSTSFGVLAALHPTLLLYLFIGWLAIFIATKTVGLASIFFFLALPLCSAYAVQADPALLYLALFMSIWGLFLHRDNIRRLF